MHDSARYYQCTIPIASLKKYRLACDSDQSVRVFLTRLVRCSLFNLRSVASATAQDAA